MSDLGDRMKAYESCAQVMLPRRMPLIIRVDGRAFHTFTRHLRRPFDPNLMDAMVRAAVAVAEDVQGFELGYVQSDEASFFLQDYALVDTEPWFGKDLQKIVSLSASIMSIAFSRAFGADAHFDSRAFVLPEAEVANYFLWRAKDWERNSLSMLAQAHFSAKQLHGKKRADMHEMLHGIGVNWTTDLSERERNGTFLVKDGREIVLRTDVLPNYTDVAAVRSASGSAERKETE